MTGKEIEDMFGSGTAMLDAFTSGQNAIETAKNSQSVDETDLPKDLINIAFNLVTINPAEAFSIFFNAAAQDDEAKKNLNKLVTSLSTIAADFGDLLGKSNNVTKVLGIIPAVSDLVENIQHGTEEENVVSAISLAGELVRLATAPIVPVSAPFGVIDLSVSVLTAMYLGSRKWDEALQDGEYTQKEKEEVSSTFFTEFLDRYTKGLTQIYGDLFNNKEQVILTDSHVENYTANANTKIVIAALRTKKTSIKGEWTKIILGSYSAKNTIWGGFSDDMISGGEQADSILGDASAVVSTANSLVGSGNGNDTILGGAGDDYINGCGGNDLIHGDKTFSLNREDLEKLDDDNILAQDDLNISRTNDGNDNLVGGDGDDKIYGEGGNDKLSGDAGNDRLWGNAGNDTLWGSDGSDLLIGGADDDLLIGGAGNDTAYMDAGNDTLSYGSGDPDNTAHGDDIVFNYDSNDVIRLLNVNLVSSHANGDDFVLEVENSAALNSITIKDAADKDILVDDNGTLITLHAESKDDQHGSGKNFMNHEDNVSMSGTAGDDTLTNWSTYYEYYTDTGEIIQFYYRDKGNDVTITGGGGNDSIYSSGERTSINAGDDNDTVETYGNGSYILGGEGNDLIHNFGKLVGEGSQLLVEDKGDNVTINGGTGDDTIINEGGANLLIVYNAGDGNDIIRGFNTTSALSISGGDYTSQTSGSDVIITVDDGKITLEGAALLPQRNIRGTYGGSDTVPADSDTLILSNMSKSFVRTGSSVETVDASSRVLAVEIFGNGLDNSIVGGLNDDILAGGEGSDTLTGGKGKNVFVYTAGNDVITDYKAGKDSILFANSYSSATVVGSDVVFTTTDGALTVENAAGKELDVDGEKIVVGTSAGAETLTVNNQSKSPVELGTATKSVDASKRITRIEIVGNDLDNKIDGGMSNDILNGGAGNDSIVGNAGNDTLIGGAGNDLLWGNSGRDTFIYESGNDVIFGFDNKDLLEIGGDFTADIDGDNIKLTVDNGSVTLKEFTATNFNINGESYVISEGNFVKR